MRKILEEGLLKANALIAVLTKEAAARPWVIWETASVWARGKLVIPLFVDVEPHEVAGPLTSKAQGVPVASRDKINEALVTIAKRLGLPKPHPITEEEHRSLLGDT